MMTTVISDNEFSDGWRPVSAHDICFHIKQVVQQPQEPGVFMATELDASFLPYYLLFMERQPIMHTD